MEEKKEEKEEEEEEDDEVKRRKGERRRGEEEEADENKKKKNKNKKNKKNRKNNNKKKKNKKKKQQQQQQLTDNEYRERDASKRKWGKYSLQAWGKRKWSAANRVAAWGKRDASDEDGEQKWRLEDPTAWNKLQQPEAAGKRRWSANSGMQAWGKRSQPYVDGRSKRSVGSDDELALMPYFLDDEQRQWVPVKRQWRKTAGHSGGPKRKWEYNTMKTWGKRRADWTDQLERVDGRIWPKRSWSSDNSLRVWG